MARKLGGGGGTALVVREGRDSFKRVFKKSEMLNKARKRINFYGAACSVGLWTVTVIPVKMFYRYR